MLPEEHTNPLLDWAVRLQSIAQAGLFHNNTSFDRERYEQVRAIAVEMIAFQGDLPEEKVRELVCNEYAYQTPKLDTRAAIFKDNKILLVKENNGLWSLPGGGVEVNLSIQENTVKEVWEEAGLVVTARRVIALHERDRHNHPIYAHKICKVFVECSLIGGEFHPNSETVDSGYFALDALPPLCIAKNTEEQIRLCFEAHSAEHWEAVFD